jgi:hypothetical protein
MNERDIADELINANNIIFNVIIRRLHENRLIDKDIMRAILLALADEPRPSEPLRYDLVQFQRLAEMLSNSDPGPRWSPVVIQGRHKPENS